MAQEDQGLDQSSDQTSVLERRKFLAACGRFAVVTPPAISVLLSTSLNSTAIASSGGTGNNGNGNGNGGGSGSGGSGSGGSGGSGSGGNGNGNGKDCTIKIGPICL